MRSTCGDGAAIAPVASDDPDRCVARAASRRSARTPIRRCRACRRRMPTASGDRSRAATPAPQDRVDRRIEHAAAPAAHETLGDAPRSSRRSPMRPTGGACRRASVDGDAELQRPDCGRRLCLRAKLRRRGASSGARSCRCGSRWRRSGSRARSCRKRCTPSRCSTASTTSSIALHTDGSIVFSVASMVEPGTFDLEKMPRSLYPGVTLFAQLPGPVPGMHALNELVACARRLQANLGGTLQDDRGVPLTVHRIERMRQEVREFERPPAGGGRGAARSPRTVSYPTVRGRPWPTAQPGAPRQECASCASSSSTTTIAITCSTIRKSPTPNTTACCASSRRSKRNTRTSSRPIRRRSASARRPSASCRRSCIRRRCCRSTTRSADEDVIAFDRRVRERLEDVEQIEYAAEPKLDGLAVSFRYEVGPAGAGRDARRRPARRRRHAQRAHHQGRADASARQPRRSCSKSAAKCSCCIAGFKAMNERALERGEQDVRQSAQRRRRQHSPARSAARRGPPARCVLLRRRRDRRLEAAGEAQRSAAAAARVGPEDFAARCESCKGVEGCLRVLPRHRRSSAPALPYEIDGVVYKVNRFVAAARAGLRRARAALGDRAQIPGA